MTTLKDHIMKNYQSITDYATCTERKYSLVKRWCDKGAVIMGNMIYVPSVQLPDKSATDLTTLKAHINERYDGNLSHAAEYLGHHRNQFHLWCKSDAILINGRIWIPRGVA